MSHRRKKRKLKQKYFLKQKAQINADSGEKISSSSRLHPQNMAMAGLFTRPHH
jgi:hypothetical protein